jgi:multidrug resistance efflux pump
MIRRVVLIVIAIIVLGALIAFSQYRAEPDRVSGYIEADEIRLGSRVGGRVEQVHVEEGQRVTARQLLVELEPYDLLERQREAAETLAAREAEFQRLSEGLRPEEVGQAKSRFDQLQARLELLEAGPREQEIDAARGRVQVAEAELSLAQEVYDRQIRLFESNATSRENVDQASEDLESAKANVVVRRKELELLEAGTRAEEIREAQAKVEEARQAWELAVKGFRQEEIEQARAARDAAQAALEAIGQQVQELQIESPVDGIVEALELQKGDLVPAGGPVLSIMDHHHLWVRAYVPENRVGLQTGQKLYVTVDSFPGERFLGEVTFISRQAEFTPNNVQTPEERSKQVFRIKVTLQEGLDKVRPGMAADVWLEPVIAAP